MDDVLSKRQHQILLSLVQEFIDRAEPVGSSTLARKYGISASPATIRNEMARLEDMGYLYQPHTSSGRVPTDKAYRYYVNFLLKERISPPEDVQRVLREFESFDDHINRMVEYASKLLADLTHYTSLVLAPRLRKTMFKYLKLAPLEGNQVLIILLTNTGSVINKLIQVDVPLSEESLERMTNILNRRLSGMYLGDIKLDFLKSIERGLHQEILRHLSLLTMETLQREDTLVYDGALNLLDLPEFQNIDRLKRIMELLEEEKIVADILKKTLSTEKGRIYIGREVPSQEPLDDITFITAPYYMGHMPIGSVGVLGPMRMPYHRIIPVVDAIAKIFSKKLTQKASE